MVSRSRLRFRTRLLRQRLDVAASEADEELAEGCPRGDVALRREVEAGMLERLLPRGIPNTDEVG